MYYNLKIIYKQVFEHLPCYRAVVVQRSRALFNHSSYPQVGGFESRRCTFFFREDLEWSDKNDSTRNIQLPRVTNLDFLKGGPQGRQQRTGRTVAIEGDCHSQFKSSYQLRRQAPRKTRLKNEIAQMKKNEPRPIKADFKVVLYH